MAAQREREREREREERSLEERGGDLVFIEVRVGERKDLETLGSSKIS